MGLDGRQIFGFLVNQVFTALVCHKSLFLFFFDWLVGGLLGYWRRLIDPLDCSRLGRARVFLVWRRNRPHLRIDESVSQKQLFASISRVLI